METNVLTTILASVNTAISNMVAGIGTAVGDNVGIVLPLAGGIAGLFIVWRVGKRLAKA